jgi:hypothetical protein
LLNEHDIERVSGSLESASFRPDLIVLDTLARLIPGADENSAQDMGRAVAAIDHLRRQHQRPFCCFTTRSRMESGSAAQAHCAAPPMS